MKFKFKKILIVVMLLFLLNNSVFADLSDANLVNDSVLFNKLQEVLGTIANWKMGSMMIPITTLVTALALIIFLVLWVLFVGTNATGAATFPFPDQIIFNRLPLFDANFINPYRGTVTNSLAADVQATISDLYYSFHAIGIAVFTIAALVMGIKLVISTIASEKAQYKEAVSKWLFGIVLLFTIHWVMAGVFALNEEIVKAVKNAVGTTVTFKVSVIQSIPLVR